MLKLLTFFFLQNICFTKNMLSCPNLDCPKGTYLLKCTCRSNKENCDTFNENISSCEICSNAISYSMKEDLVQGDRCVKKDLVLIILVPVIPIIQLILLTIICRKCILNKCICCQPHGNCCYKGWRCICVCLEKVMKCMFCVNCTEGGLLCCKFCFDRLVAIEPYEKTHLENNQDDLQANGNPDNNLALVTLNNNENNNQQNYPQNLGKENESDLTFKNIDKPQSGMTPQGSIENKNVERQVLKKTPIYYRPPKPIVINNIEPTQNLGNKTFEIENKLSVIAENYKQNENEMSCKKKSPSKEKEIENDKDLKKENQPIDGGKDELRGNSKITMFSNKSEDKEIKEGRPFPKLPPNTMIKKDPRKKPRKL